MSTLRTLFCLLGSPAGDC